MGASFLQSQCLSCGDHYFWRQGFDAAAALLQAPPNHVTVGERCGGLNGRFVPSILVFLVLCSSSQVTGI
jgi:hypothetical protein